MNIYVGNLAYTMSEDGLKDAFEAFGAVDSARIIMDRETNRSKGFGFVEMSDDSEAKAAIEALNQTELDGRKLVVNEARPRQPRSDRGGGGGYGRGGGGGRGGFGGGQLRGSALRDPLGDAHGSGPTFVSPGQGHTPRARQVSSEVAPRILDPREFHPAGGGGFRR
jgi:RNA recognition motif-containing protein